jgi:undecaprenyl diphosphate synthase
MSITSDEMTVYMKSSAKDLLIPRHIAIIMDGNRRWAKQRGIAPAYGHWKGADVIMNIVRLASNLGVEVLTLYAFSTENWARSPDEIDELMKLICFYLENNQQNMIEESVRLETIGDLSRLPIDVQSVIRRTKEATSAGKKITLVLALNYGGRDEIKRAFVGMAKDLESGKITLQDISESLISSYLDTASLGDPDLFIRTSGEQRLSNFLLWQLSYTEVYVTQVLWPDFTQDDLLDAIREFQKRNRRLGGT